MTDQTKQHVSEYYQSLLQGKTQLKTDSCCVLSDAYAEYTEILNQIHEDILKKNYGCGSPIPPFLKGCTVVDLGSGAGRDVYLCGALVGDEGKVIGVDMTEEMIQFASKYKEYHKKIFNQKNDVVEFRKGYIEDLKSIGIEDNSVDVVISNCVINLSPEKQKVFNEIYRVLKQGGELFFSDIFADRRIPKHLQDDTVLWGECLSGALYIEDFRRMLQNAGFKEFRIVETREIGDLEGIIERLKEKNEGKLDIHFFSVTIRAIKLDSLEDTQEDYQQFATLLGSDKFKLDIVNCFSKGQIRRVSGNTAEILQNTRYKSLFTVTERGRHTGPFKTPNYYDLMNIGKNQQLKGGCCGGTTSESTEQKKGCCKKQQSESCCKGDVKQCCKKQTTEEQKTCCKTGGETKQCCKTQKSEEKSCCKGGDTKQCCKTTEEQKTCCKGDVKQCCKKETTEVKKSCCKGETKQCCKTQTEGQKTCCKGGDNKKCCKKETTGEQKSCCKGEGETKQCCKTQKTEEQKTCCKGDVKQCCKNETTEVKKSCCKRETKQCCKTETTGEQKSCCKGDIKQCCKTTEEQKCCCKKE